MLVGVVASTVAGVGVVVGAADVVVAASDVDGGEVVAVDEVGGVVVVAAVVEGCASGELEQAARATARVTSATTLFMGISAAEQGSVAELAS